MPFTPRELTEEEVKAIREFQGGIMAGRKQFRVSETRYRKIREAPTLEEALKMARTDNKSSGQGTAIPLAGVKAKQAPVTFVIKNEQVQLEPSDLYECYYLYQDLKARHSIEETFSDTLNAAMEFLWSLCNKPVIEEGGVVKLG